MKLILLAAGRGTRLAPLTDDRPKCLVEYRGKPLLDYTLEAANIVGLRDVIAITGYRSEMIEAKGLRCVRNNEYESSNMLFSLFCAEEELDDDVIVSYGDIIYRPEVLQKLIAAPQEVAVVVDRDWERYWRERMEDPLADAETLKLDEEGRILELGRKPERLEDIEAQYIGLFKIGKSAWPEVKALYHEIDTASWHHGRPVRDMYMTDFLQLLIDRVAPVYAVEISGSWMEVDCASDLNYQLEL